jgi:VIT1/CCC1 family predicted Fe2+/Mn2+ transporter
MSQLDINTERHFVDRIGWLRAAVLGANDGIVSTASLITGVASASAGHSEILLAGTAGLVAGAMSMAAGEYVSVSSQSDSEQADLARERKELKTQPEFELNELAGIYETRGLTPQLALQVAQELTKHNALEAHARDELGLSVLTQSNPLQAAGSSAVAFTVGAALPLAAVLATSEGTVIWVTTTVSLIALAVLGAISARSGGAPITRAVLRVTFWGAVAMAATAGVGLLFGTTVA